MNTFMNCWINYTLWVRYVVVACDILIFLQIWLCVVPTTVFPLKMYYGIVLLLSAAQTSETNHFVDKRSSDVFDKFVYRAE